MSLAIRVVRRAAWTAARGELVLRVAAALSNGLSVGDLVVSTRAHGVVPAAGGKRLETALLECDSSVQPNRWRPARAVRIADRRRAGRFIGTILWSEECGFGHPWGTEVRLEMMQL